MSARRLPMQEDRVAAETAYLAMFGLERVVDVLGEIEGVRPLTAREKRAGSAAVKAVQQIIAWWDADRRARLADPARAFAGTRWAGTAPLPCPRGMVGAVRRAAAAIAAIGGTAVIGEERDMTTREAGRARHD